MAEEKEVKAKVQTKAERVEAITKEMEKQFGKGTVMGAQDKSQVHDHISTGSLGLDKALGIGGLPRGRIVEIIGWESSGKTTLAIHTIAEAHKNPEAWCAFVDVEHAFDTRYAQNLGVDLMRLKISQPDNAEQALEIADKYAESGEFDVVVIDSVAALVPIAEVERKMGESSMGKQAILMSQAMRKLTPIVAKSNTLMVFINQMREKIGVMFGNPNTTPGGNALKFYASVRLEVTRYISKEKVVMDGEERTGNEVKVRVLKNKTAPPFKECIFDIMYGTGIDKYGELITAGVECGVLSRSGTWFSYGEDKIGQGRAKVVEMLKDNDELYNEIRHKVIDSYTPVAFQPEIEKDEE